MIRRKYESIDGIYPDVREYYEDRCDSSCFADAESIDNTTEDCIEYLVTECGYDEDVVNSDTWYRKIKRYLINLSNESESLNRKLESRIRRLERLLLK